MKKLLLLSLVGVLSACATDYDKRKVQYTLIQNTSDPRIKLQLLEKQKVEDCQKNLGYYACAQVTANIAAVATLRTKQYALAIQNAETSFKYKTKEWDKYYYTDDPRSKFSNYCFSTWSFRAGFNDSERKKYLKLSL